LDNGQTKPASHLTTRPAAPNRPPANG
jgi:hypothetical protein